MITIEQIDTESTSQVQRFLDLPHRLYANCPQWVPPLALDAALQLNRQENPFFEQAEADFFIAVNDGRDAGRIAVFASRNNPDGEAKFYLFECENNVAVASMLFEVAFDWARTRGLKTIIGPRGFNPFLDASGLLVEGFGYRQAMNLTTYNYVYYPALIEQQGFIKQQDTITCHREVASYQGPSWLYDLADKLSQKKTFTVLNFSTISEIQSRTFDILKLLQITTGSGLQNSAQTISDRELVFTMSTFLRRVDPRLIKAITHEDTMVGIIFGFPNLSELLQQTSGRVEPETLRQAIPDTPGVIINGLVTSPEFQLQGLSLLLFMELEKTVREGNFKYGDIVQIADEDQPLRRDLDNFGLQPTQRHRDYARQLNNLREGSL